MTPEEENAKIRADVAREIEAEESGIAMPTVDAGVVAATQGDMGKIAQDPWAGLNPSLKSVFDEMSQKVATLSAAEMRLRQAESRIGAINSELHAAREAMRTVKESPTKEQMAAAAESDEKWNDLKKDFPEWAEAFDGRFDQKITAEMNKLRNELKTVTPSPDSASLPEAIEERLLSFVKPKWRETIASAEWKEWLAMQPQEEAAKIYSPTAEDAVSLLTNFEASKKGKTATQIAAERSDRLRTSILPQGGKAIPIKSEADMTAPELRAKIGREVYAET